MYYTNYTFFFYKNKFYNNIRLRFDLLLRIKNTILIKKKKRVHLLDCSTKFFNMSGYTISYIH